MDPQNGYGERLRMGADCPCASQTMERVSVSVERPGSDGDPPELHVLPEIHSVRRIAIGMYGFVRMSVLFGAVAVSTLSISRAQDRALALTHVAVVDVVAGNTRPDETVLIKGERIVAVGPSVPIPAEARRVDLAGKFIVPGFFDMHAHTGLVPGLIDDASRWQLIEDALRPRMREGIVGVRDMGSYFDEIPALAHFRSADARSLPRVWLTGPPITGPVGDPDFHISVNNPIEGRQTVERLSGAGVDFIKVHDWLSADVYPEVIRAARSAGLQVVGHVPAALTTEAVVEAGQRDIEHLGPTAILRSCSDATVPSAATLRSAVGDEEVAYSARMSDAYLTPLLDGFNAGRCRALARRLAQEKVWQVPTLTWWQTVTVDVPPAARTGPFQRLFTTLLQIVGMMSDEGVPIMTGLDLRKTISDEIQLLVRAGLSPAAALRAATIAPAQFLGVEDSSGTIAPGRLADVVILDGDPLADVSATRRIHAVFIKGKQILDPRPPVIDIHIHSAQMSPEEFAETAAENVRYIFLSGVSTDLRAWATGADQKRYLPSLVFPCDRGRAPGPNRGRTCFDSGTDFPDVSWLRDEIRSGRVRGLGELAPQYIGMTPNDSRLEPYWELAEEFDIPVSIHMGPGPPGSAYDSNPSPFKSPAFRMAAGDPLLLEDVLLRDKRLRLFVMHAGWPRLDSMLALLYAHPNVYVDLGVLQFPMFVPREGYWAYAGFAITLGSALIAHLAVGDGVEAWGFAAGTGVLWGFSYFFWRRLQAPPATD
jgi:imidazolonepropionase-like amidohydrolase